MVIDSVGFGVLKDCAEKRSPVFFSADNVDIVFQTYILKAEKDHILLQNRVPPAHIKNVITSQKFFLQCQMMRFFSEKIASDGVNIVFPLESLMAIEETRQAKRFPFDADERVVVEILNPFDKETLLVKSVMDMSSHGLSIKSRYASDLFVPGTELRDMRILIDGNLYHTISGKVVYRRKFLSLDGKSYNQIGLQFDAV